MSTWSTDWKPQYPRCPNTHSWIYVFVQIPSLPSSSLCWVCPQILLKISFRGPGPLPPAHRPWPYLGDGFDANCFPCRCVQPALCICDPNHAKSQVVALHYSSWAQLALSKPIWFFPVCVLSVLFLVPTCYYFYISCFTLPLINLLSHIMCIKYLQMYIQESNTRVVFGWKGSGRLWDCLKGRPLNV